MREEKIAAVIWTIFTLLMCVIGFFAYTTDGHYLKLFGVRLSLSAFLVLIITFLIIDITTIIGAYKSTVKRQETQK